MAWTWDQSDGALYDAKGRRVAKGYSGYEFGKNNPAMQDRVAVGPIPAGKWRIGSPRNSRNVGPYAMDLSPVAGTQTFGRSAFMIHGDSAKQPGKASRGCIILPRPIREMIWLSGDRDLTVVA